MTIPQIIVNENGHSYLGNASRAIGHKEAQDILTQALALQQRGHLINKYFIAEFRYKKLCFIEAWKNGSDAIKSFLSKDTRNLIIVHFDELFLSEKKSTL